MPRKATSKVEQDDSVAARPSRASRKATSYNENVDESENDQDEDDFELKKKKPRKTKNTAKLPAKDNKRKREAQNEEIENKKTKKPTKSNKISAVGEAGSDVESGSEDENKIDKMSSGEDDDEEIARLYKEIAAKSQNKPVKSDKNGSDVESGSENSENKIEKMSSDEDDDEEIARLYREIAAKGKLNKKPAKASQKKEKGKKNEGGKPKKVVKSDKNAESEEEAGSNLESGKENSEDEQKKMSTDEESENELPEEKSAISEKTNASASDEDDENEITGKMSAESKEAHDSDQDDIETPPKKSVEVDFSNDSVSPKGEAWNYKISSWNINGVRAWMEKEGLEYLQKEKPDIMCVQETKCSDDKLPEAVKSVQGYYAYWLSGDKDGYSGVGLLSKDEPISVKYGIDIPEHDNEGRVITAEYPKFYVVAAYVPNAGRGLVRLEYRMLWDKDFRCYLKKLDEKKPVILCGDLNVAHEEIDLANPKTNKKNAGFTKEERDGFTSLLGEGFIDSFRHLYPDMKGAYTFWTYMKNAREKNVGWRLDYFVISEKLKENLCDSVIRKDIPGSDHCPVTLFLHI